MQGHSWTETKSVALVDDILDVGWITEREHRNAIERIEEGEFFEGVESALKQAGIG